MGSAKILIKLRSMFNEERLSDCCFVVGDDKILVYAHKFVLSTASEVFERMLYGELASKDYEPIVIPDLEPNGFLNMLKYLYGHEIDYSLDEIYQTYLAADKYIISDLMDELDEIINAHKHTDAICLVYDQAIQINQIKESQFQIQELKNLIIQSKENAFKADSFIQISGSTLIDLLSFDTLNVKEIELLKACSKWINNQAEKSGIALKQVKQKMFTSFKELISFEEISFEDLSGFSEIADLLTSDEISKLFLHLLDPSNLISFGKLVKRKKSDSHIPF